MRRPPRILALAVLAAVAAPAGAPALAGRSMAGSSVDLIAPDVADPGDQVTFAFYVFNGSPDSEWTTDVVITFPGGFTVLDGSYDDGEASGAWSFAFLGAGTSVAHWADDDEGYGEIADGEGGAFSVAVRIGDDCGCGAVVIHWLQQGDIWGQNPHYIEGDLAFRLCGGTPEDGTWSRVKSLY
ncbi:MAG: hypothetical protein JW819_03670 [Candidatus Krumholzibacteriota bacterium]|nr:hypothetical protein [Candidatus Krumholzibacteriota bacterium]